MFENIGGLETKLDPSRQSASVRHDSLDLLRTFERRRDEHPKFVYNTGSEESAVGARATLNHEVSDAKIPRQNFEHGADVDLWACRHDVRNPVSGQLREMTIRDITA